MNYFLILIILGLCGGGYYEYITLQQKSTENQQQLSYLDDKVDTLQSENKKLEDDKAQLTKSVNDAQAEIADLTKQIQEAQSPKTDHPAMEAAAQSPASNNLGTITTLGGKTFQNCQLLKVKTDGIVINYSGGITEISYGLLPPDLQKKFGYDPHQAAALTEAQIQFQEEQRKAAAQAAGN